MSPGVEGDFEYWQENFWNRAVDLLHGYFKKKKEKTEPCDDCKKNGGCSTDKSGKGQGHSPSVGAHGEEVWGNWVFSNSIIMHSCEVYFHEIHETCHSVTFYFMKKLIF